MNASKILIGMRSLISNASPLLSNLVKFVTSVLLTGSLYCKEFTAFLDSNEI
jgi:hypothetical protein